MRQLAYQVHPYQWMTIGKELSHIEQAKLQNVKDFFFKHYTPCNAILVVAGHVHAGQVLALAEKWFGGIPAGTKYQRQLPQEPSQAKARKKEMVSNVPLDLLCKTWHMPGRLDKNYHATDLLTDILGGNNSSRLYQQLVKEQKLFVHLDCYHFGSSDPGLLTIEGKLTEGVNMEQAEQAIQQEIDKICKEGPTEQELQKVKNKTESSIAFEDMSVMSRASSIAYYELLGDAALMNTELNQYAAVTTEQIKQLSHDLLRSENSNTLYYYANK